MPRKFIKRYVPSAKEFHQRNSFFGFFGNHLHQAGLWHLNRRSVSKAVAIGFFCMWLPIPFQTLLAAFLAVVFIANLPISVLLVFITNPITIPPMFFIAYQTGASLLGMPSEPLTFEFSTGWMKEMFLNSWEPLLLGSLLLATITSLIGYILVRILWRLHIIQRWKDRNNHKP